MKKIKEMILFALTNFWANLKTKVVLKSDIVNDSNSSSTDKPLSANQGKVLKEEISELNENISSHRISGDHDGRYYTEAEVNNLLSGKTNTGHTHSYAGSTSAGGSANSAVKLDSSAGSATQPVYFAGGKPVACTHTLGKSVPSNAVFTDTNTWRGIQNNLTSTAADQSLSAAQGKILNESKARIVRASWGTSIKVTQPHGIVVDAGSYIALVWCAGGAGSMTVRYTVVSGTNTTLTYSINKDTGEVTIAKSDDSNSSITYIGA